MVIVFLLIHYHQFQQAIVSLKLYEIPEDQTPQLYVSEGIEAKNIYLVTNN